MLLLLYIPWELLLTEEIKLRDFFMGSGVYPPQGAASYWKALATLAVYTKVILAGSNGFLLIKCHNCKLRTSFLPAIN